MTTKEIYERANKVAGLDGMTGIERLTASGLMELFDKTKKRDKYTARTILEALKFDELSIGRQVGFSIDSLKYPNPWNFPDVNPNGQVGDEKATLKFSNLMEIAMGAPIGGMCILYSNKLQNSIVNPWCGGPVIWTKNGQKAAIPFGKEAFYKERSKELAF